MPAPVEFYFEFSSPYGYLAAREVDALGARHGREVVWRPYLLGIAMKQTGQAPLLTMPLKGEYARRDLQRSARAMGFAFRLPDPFPFLAVNPSRAFYWLEKDDAAAARRLARAIYDAAFTEGRDMSKAEAVADVAAALGHDREAALAACNDPALKDRLREETEKAIAKGCFGSPILIVDGEPFWGFDKFPEAERWLETGGW